MQNKVEIIYDQVIATDRPVGANRPDLIVRDVAKKKVMIVDVSCPCDLNVEKKELEKVSKYAGLKAELQRMWGVSCEAVSTSCSDSLRDSESLIPGVPDLRLCQKITLMGSERILRNALSRRR